jgi:hypothetical protein
MLNVSNAIKKAQSGLTRLRLMLIRPFSANQLSNGNKRTA